MDLIEKNQSKITILILISLITCNIVSYFNHKADNSKFEILLFLSYYLLFLIYYNQFYNISINTIQLYDNIFLKNNCILRSVINLISYVIFFYTLLIPFFKHDFYTQKSYYEQIIFTINFCVLPFTLSYISYHDNIKQFLLYDNVFIYDEENNQNKKYTRNTDGYSQV
jgi:hypothetical protein